MNTKAETWADSPIHDMIREAGLDNCERTAPGPSDASASSPSSDTPETDAMSSTMFPDGSRWVQVEDCRKFERQRDELFYSAAAMAGDLAALRTAVRNLRDVKGRHHTQLATERLFSLLPENAESIHPESKP